MRMTAIADTGQNEMMTVADIGWNEMTTVADIVWNEDDGCCRHWAR